MPRPQLAIVRSDEPFPQYIHFSEKLADHHAILEGYLKTHITRNHSELTFDTVKRFLTGWFAGNIVEDDTHPEGERQLFIWEAMIPIVGRERIQEFSAGLIKDDKLLARTVTTYLGMLRRLFDYVLLSPYIPNSNGLSIVAKYGPIEQPVLEFDYPSHVLDHEDAGFVLTGEELQAFYAFIREVYMPSKQKQGPLARNYTMIVVAGECGLRADEIRHLDRQDLYYTHGLLQTRYGKATNGSGKRVRKTIFLERAQETLHYYENKVRPTFKNATESPALFLSETGTRISYSAMYHGLENIVRALIKAKIDLELPPKFGWHNLRKSFATNYMIENPDKVWHLMNWMGHSNLGTLWRYILPGPGYFEQGMENHTRIWGPKGS